MKPGTQVSVIFVLSVASLVLGALKPVFSLVQLFLVGALCWHAVDLREKLK